MPPFTALWRSNDLTDSTMEGWSRSSGHIEQEGTEA